MIFKFYAITITSMLMNGHPPTKLHLRIMEMAAVHELGMAARSKSIPLLGLRLLWVGLFIMVHIKAASDLDIDYRSSHFK